jgi:transposase InsO family protein
VQSLAARGKCSERHACRLLGVARSTARYRRRVAADEPALRKRILELAHRHKRYGYRFITQKLRQEGWRVNRKRVHRLWREAGLQRSRKRRRKRGVGPSAALPLRATRPNQVWSYDFMEDRAAGGKLRLLNVLDEFTRECLQIRVDKSIGAQKVIATLEWLFLLHGAPDYIRSDNGPEFIAKALRQWLGERGAKTLYITPGSPWENPFIESFNDKLRDECLNMHLFVDLEHAATMTEQWRIEYNQERPHSSLNYQTPAQFAAHYRNSSRPTASLRYANEQEPGKNTQVEENTLTKAGT